MRVRHDSSLRDEMETYGENDRCEIQGRRGQRDSGLDGVRGGEVERRIQRCWEKTDRCCPGMENASGEMGG